MNMRRQSSLLKPHKTTEQNKPPSKAQRIKAMNYLSIFAAVSLIPSVVSARRIGIHMDCYGQASIFMDGKLVKFWEWWPFSGSVTTDVEPGERLLALGLYTSWCGVAIAIDGVYAFQMDMSMSPPWRATAAVTNLGWNSVLNYNDSDWGNIGIRCSPVTTRAFQMYNGSPYYAHP